MDWRYMPQRKIAGMPSNRRVYTQPSDRGIRFLVVGHGKLYFTATYPTFEDGEQQLPVDYQRGQLVAVDDGCALCGRVITSTNARAKFCSRECNKRYHAREQTKRKKAARERLSA